MTSNITHILPKVKPPPGSLRALEGLFSGIGSMGTNPLSAGQSEFSKPSLGSFSFDSPGGHPGQESGVSPGPGVPGVISGRQEPTSAITGKTGKAVSEPWRPYRGPELPLDSLATLQGQLASIILTIRQTCGSVCCVRFWKFACVCGFKIVRSGCMRTDCPDCARAVGARRATKVKQRLDAGRKKGPICYTVFTVPPALRAKYADRVEWRKLVKLVAWPILRDQFGAEFALECSHPIGDKEENDFDVVLFHPHANFLWVPKPGKSAWVDVDRLRAAWSDALGAPADVWTHYYASRYAGEIHKRIAYVVRTFPGFSSWLGPMRWYGHFPRKIAKFIWVCQVCNEPFYCCGMSDLDEYTEYKARQGLENQSIRGVL